MFHNYHKSAFASEFMIIHRQTLKKRIYRWKGRSLLPLLPPCSRLPQRPSRPVCCRPPRLQLLQRPQMRLVRPYWGHSVGSPYHVDLWPKLVTIGDHSRKKEICKDRVGCFDIDQRDLCFTHSLSCPDPTVSQFM